MSKSKAHLLKKKVAKPVKNTEKSIVMVAVPDVPSKPSRLKSTPEHQQWFVLSSGKEIKNLKELAQDLGDMEDFVFDHHVNQTKNDFVNWVRDVFDELELAERISKVKDKKKMQLVVYNYLLEKMW
jgi:hypothetical protein